MEFVDVSVKEREDNVTQRDKQQTTPRSNDRHQAREEVKRDQRQMRASKSGETKR